MLESGDAIFTFDDYGMAELLDVTIKHPKPVVFHPVRASGYYQQAKSQSESRSITVKGLLQSFPPVSEFIGEEFDRVVGRFAFIQEKVTGPLGLWEMILAFNFIEHINASFMKTIVMPIAPPNKDNVLTQNQLSFQVARILGWVVSERADEETRMVRISEVYDCENKFYEMNTKRRKPTDRPWGKELLSWNQSFRCETCASQGA